MTTTTTTTSHKTTLSTTTTTTIIITTTFSVGTLTATNDPWNDSDDSGAQAFVENVLLAVYNPVRDVDMAWAEVYVYVCVCECVYWCWRCIIRHEGG
jgi:hypothetical protein